MITAGGRTANIKAPMSQASTQSGQLPGAPNLPNTLGTGTSRDWAADFRAQNTPQMQSPFNPDFDDKFAGMLPNGGGNQGYMAMFGGQSQPPQFTPPPLPTPHPPNPGSVVPPLGPTQAQSPFQATGGGNYQSAMSGIGALNTAGGQSTPTPTPTATPQGPTQQEMDANQRYMQQAIEFATNPQYRLPSDLIGLRDNPDKPWTDQDTIANLNAGGHMWKQLGQRDPSGIERRTAAAELSGADYSPPDPYEARDMFGAYWGNPYIDQGTLQSAYDSKMASWRNAQNTRLDGGDFGGA